MRDREGPDEPREPGMAREGMNPVKRTGTALIVLLAFGAMSRGAIAAGPAALGETPAWTLDTSKIKPVPKKRIVPPHAVSADEAARAARLVEARRKFFENRSDDPKPKPIPEFGGYDGRTMGDGSLKPTTGFRF